MGSFQSFLVDSGLDFRYHCRVAKVAVMRSQRELRVLLSEDFDDFGVLFSFRTGVLCPIRESPPNLSSRFHCSLGNCAWLGSILFA